MLYLPRKEKTDEHIENVDPAIPFHVSTLAYVSNTILDIRCGDWSDNVKYQDP